jgi:putative ABC transport system substrate-binding protein
VIDRRSFARIVVAGLLAAPFAVGAQTIVRARRIGFLAGWRDAQPWEAPLRSLGWIEGKNLVIERRTMEGGDLLPSAADELVRLKPELIITDGTEAALAAKNATTSIPIVMASAGDPVAMGIVTSLARPGGNITGYSILSPEMAAKRAALIRDLLPAVQRVAVVLDGTNKISDLLRKSAEAAYRSLGVQPLFIQASSSEEVRDRLGDATRQGIQAVEIDFDIPGDDAARIIAAANRYRLPVIATGRHLLDAGALMSLDVNTDELGQRVAAIIDKLLHGAKPADLPIEQPTKFTLIVNMKAAKALGIAFPQSMLLRADEVIR